MCFFYKTPCFAFVAVALIIGLSVGLTLDDDGGGSQPIDWDEYCSEEVVCEGSHFKNDLQVLHFQKKYNCIFSKCKTCKLLLY